MRVRSVLPAMALALVLYAPRAYAALFDGKWIADIPAVQGCAGNGASTITLLVTGGDIQGQIQNVRSRVGVTGAVDADGNGTIHVAQAAEGTVKFSGDHFDVDWAGGLGCSRHGEGDRAMDEKQQTQLVADRKHHQEVFASLVKSANQGEKIDYAALRAEYVYSEDWDFYDTKLGTLVEQADAAAKGKDCPKAVSLAERAVKADFLVDAAHAIGGACLADSDPDRAKIESGIADGLIHSLMDSGNGDNEQTAYVVSSLREEMDVLANRHISFKTRQTQVRGSNGHYFDVVQGISLSAGAAASRTIYFDIGSFMAGRESKRAAVAAAAAEIH